MKFLLLIVMLLCSCPLFAQEENEWKEASKESQAYHAYRSKVSTPPYELVKVKGL